jgi:succinate-acetate transporter protein
MVKVTGYIGIVTAIAAWYASAAALSEGMAGRIQFPLGKPLVS